MSREIPVPCCPPLRSGSIASNKDRFVFGNKKGREEEKEGNEEQRADLISSILYRRSA